jgi:predicted RNA-binding protein with PUA-like domain
MLRFLQCLDSRFTDGSKVVSLAHRPRSTPQKHNFSASDSNFCSTLSKLRDLVRLKVLSNLKTINLIGSRTSVFPACSIVSQLLQVVFVIM